MEKYMTPREFADRLGVDPRTVWRWMEGESPKLEFVLVAGQGKLIEIARAEELIGAWKSSRAPKDVAGLLVIPPATLRHWVGRNRFEAIKFLGTTRITKNSIDALFGRLEGDPTSEFPQLGDKVLCLMSEVGVSLQELVSSYEQGTLDIRTLVRANISLLAQQWKSSCSLSEARIKVDVSPSTMDKMVVERRIQTIKVLGQVRVVREDIPAARQEISVYKRTLGRAKRAMRAEARGRSVHVRTAWRMKQRGQIPEVTTAPRPRIRPPQRIAIGTKTSRKQEGSK